MFAFLEVFFPLNATLGVEINEFCFVQLFYGGNTSLSALMYFTKLW